MLDQKDLSLTGQCALITGAAKRIGSAIAQLLHANGADIAIHYRGSQADADHLCDQLNASRADSACLFQADIALSGAASRLVSDVSDWRRGLNILVNNASSFYPTPLGDITEEDWTDLTGSNLKGPLFLSQAAAPFLKAVGGNIVNIVDIHARKPLRDHAVYGAAKAGLGMLTKALAKELAPEVRVNGVAPGAIAWPDEGLSDEVKATILSQVPLGRSGEPRDIAEAVLFLVTEATYSSGSVIAIDGGRSAGW